MTFVFGCVNNTIRLRSGEYFDFANPDPKTIGILDIAGALSKACRFAGQCSQFYSVAEHSVHCAQVAIDMGLPPDGVMAVLMHDADEAYMLDLPKPLKNMLPDYCLIQARVSLAISVRFDIDFVTWKADIKKIDQGMLIAERNRLFQYDGVRWTGEERAILLAIQFRLWEPAEAEQAFLKMFNETQKAINNGA